MAVAQAAAVIAAQRLDYATYLERLRRLPVVSYLGRSEGDPYPRGTAEAILLSLAEVEDRDPAGLCRPVIELLAILSPAGVPRRLLYQAGQDGSLTCSGRRRQPIKPISAVEVDAAVQRLDEASLLSLSVDGLTTTVHRLVMRVVRERAEDKGSFTAVAAAAADLLGRQLAMPREHTWAQHAATGEIITQTTALWENTSGYLTATESVHDETSTIRKVLSLRLKAVWYLNEISDPTRATPLGEDLVADCQRLLGDDHPDTVGTRSNLARAYELGGRADEAVALHERVLADCQRLHGDDHSRTVGTRSNLARAYGLAGRLDEAVALHERVLADCQRLHGDDHSRTVGTRSNLARAYGLAGRLDEAVALHERVLADCQRLHGDDHPDTVGTRSNLARAYELAGRLDEAVALHERVLADCQRLHGDDHPDTVGTRSNLARAYELAGRPTRPSPCTSGSWPTASGCSERMIPVPKPRTGTWTQPGAYCCPPGYDRFWTCVRSAQPSWRFPIG